MLQEVPVVSSYFQLKVNFCVEHSPHPSRLVPTQRLAVVAFILDIKSKGWKQHRTVSFLSGVLCVHVSAHLCISLHLRGLQPAGLLHP